MRKSLSEIEQDSLRTRGVLYNNEIAYKEGNVVYAENVLTGEKRAINMFQAIKEGKLILG